MRGFGGLTDALDSLLGSAGISVQPWFFPALLMVAFGLLLPHIRQNQRTQRAREAIRKSVEEGGAASDTLREEVMSLANGHPTTLLVIAGEAHKRGFLELTRRALKALEQTGKYKREARQLRHTIDGPPPVHPEGELAVLETLIEQGLLGMARKRLERAERHWPHLTIWKEVAQRLNTEE